MVNYSGSSGLSAWQFSVDAAAYGAKGDGKVVGDVVTNSTTTITSASAGFTSADVGKFVMIHGAGGVAAGPLLSKIVSVSSATTAVLADAAAGTATGCPMVWGTDDTAAVNAALAAAGTYATGHGYHAEVIFGAKIYVLAGLTQQSSPTLQNSQLVLPFPNANGTTQKMSLLLTGAGDAGYCQYWESTVPNLAGSCLVSIPYGKTAPSSPDVTFGSQSVIGGPSGSTGLTGSFANVKVVIRGLSVWNAIYTNSYAYDLAYCSAARVQQSSAHIFAPTGVNGAATQPYLNAITAAALAASIGTGFRMPTGGNNADTVMDDCTAEGYECGFRISDHFTASRLAAIYCDVAMKWDSAQGTAGGTQHGIFIQNMTAESYNGGFTTSGGSCQVDIEWDTEGVPSAYDFNPGSALYGVIRFGDRADNRAPVISGSAPGNLKIINQNLPPGAWAGQPAVPATTVAQQNTSWRDAAVSIKGGTVTVVAVDGVTVATATGTTVIVPSGKNITLTYSVAPTWAWTLL